MTALEHRRVSPFGHLRLTRSYTPHRSFSQYNTSFIGTRCLGIHCVPLVAFRTIVRSLRLSWHATYRYYLRVDYSVLKTHSAALSTHSIQSVYDNLKRRLFKCQFCNTPRLSQSKHALVHLVASAPHIPAFQPPEIWMYAQTSHKESYKFPSTCGLLAYIPSCTCTWRTSVWCGISKFPRQSSASDSWHDPCLRPCWPCNSRSTQCAPFTSALLSLFFLFERPCLCDDIHASNRS